MPSMCLLGGYTCDRAQASTSNLLADLLLAGLDRSQSAERRACDSDVPHLIPSKDRERDLAPDVPAQSLFDLLRLEIADIFAIDHHDLIAGQNACFLRSAPRKDLAYVEDARIVVSSEVRADRSHGRAGACADER